MSARSALVVAACVVSIGCGPADDEGRAAGDRAIAARLGEGAGVLPDGGKPPATPSTPAPSASSSASLTLNQVYATFEPDDCFALGRGRLTMRVFEYKDVFAPGLGRRVHLRAWVTTPPGYDARKSGYRLPALAMFHGGGWSRGEPTTWLPAALYFASRGLVTVTFQYRLAERHRSTPPESVADAISGVRWLRKYAGDLGVDTSAIAVAGNSAGGHLALMTALAPSGAYDEVGSDVVDPAPVAIAALYPVVIAPPAAPAFAAETLLGTRPLPGTILFQSEADDSTSNPPAAARAFCTRASQATRDGCRYVSYPNLPHDFISVVYEDIVAKTDAFLMDRFAGKYSGDPARVREWVDAAAPHCRQNTGFVERWRDEFGFGEGGNGGVW